MIDIDLSGTVWFSPLGFIGNILGKLEAKTWLTINEIFWSTKHNSRLVGFVFEGIEFKFQLKQLKEYLHVSYFALSTYKEFGEKYELSMWDSPDVIMVSKNGCIPIEVYEAYDFAWELTAGEIPEIVKRLHRTKGMKSYAKWTRLLVANRYAWDFNVSEYAREIAKYKWNYAQIILSLHRAGMDDYTFFNVTPWWDPVLLDEHKMTFSLNKDMRWLY